MLRLYFFGAPRIERDGLSIPLHRSKALALLAYLALTQQPQDRDTLLVLLWLEFDDKSARNNLRRELSLLKNTFGETLLIADRQQIAWNPQANCWLDVATFTAQIAAAQQLPPASAAPVLTTAVQLAGDDFLGGFSLPDSAAFEGWQFFQRETLRQQLAEALQELAHWHSGQGEHSVAISYARRRLALDPLHEPA